MHLLPLFIFFFFFNDTATTEIYTLSLHDALPIYRGIAVDLGRELGRRLDVPVDLVAFETAGKLADAVKSGAWDVAFLGNEPQRAGEIAFSPAYLEIEAGYLVPAGSPIRSIADVDRKGVRIAVAVESAYHPVPCRRLKAAPLPPV